MNISDFFTTMDLKNAFPIVIHLQKEKYESSNLSVPVKHHNWIYDINNSDQLLKFINKYGSYPVNDWHAFELSTKTSGNIKVFYITTFLLI